MWGSLVAVVPLILVFAGAIILTVLHSSHGLRLGHGAVLRRRVRWAAASGFTAMDGLTAERQLAAALPGLTGRDEQIMVLDAFEARRCLVADLVVLTDHFCQHAGRLDARQAMTVARIPLDRQVPVLEIRPLRTWPADPRRVAQRSSAVCMEPGFDQARAQTVITGDPDFDAAFVVRAIDRREAKAFLTPELRRAMLLRSGATIAFTRATLLVIEPGIVDDAGLEGMLELAKAVRTKLALPAYVA